MNIDDDQIGPEVCFSFPHRGAYDAEMGRPRTPPSNASPVGQAQWLEGYDGFITKIALQKG